MKCRSMARTAGFHRVGHSPLQLELLEDRVPPGNLMGSDLLVGTVAPQQPPATIRRQPSGDTAGSPAPGETSKGANLTVEVSERLAAGRNQATSWWMTWSEPAGMPETSES